MKEQLGGCGRWNGVITNYNALYSCVNNTGGYVVSYVYVDGAGNTGSVDRVVNVVQPDVTAPVVTITGVSLDVEYAGSFVDPGTTWTDNVDGQDLLVPIIVEVLM